MLAIGTTGHFGQADRGECPLPLPDPADTSMAEPASSPGTAAFLSRDFRLYQMARVMVIIGAEAQALAVAWQVYQITHSALALGYTGLALFLPGVLLILPSGHVADRYDRRRVVLVCYSLQMICTATLLWFSWHGLRSIWPIYTVLALIGTGRSFSGPASSALVPHLVPKEHFVNAVTWGSTIFQIANIAGPAIGGHPVHAAAARQNQRGERGLSLHAHYSGWLSDAHLDAFRQAGKDGKTGHFD